MCLKVTIVLYVFFDLRDSSFKRCNKEVFFLNITNLQLWKNLTLLINACISNMYYQFDFDKNRYITIGPNKVFVLSTQNINIKTGYKNHAKKQCFSSLYMLTINVKNNTLTCFEHWPKRSFHWHFGFCVWVLG